MHAHICECVPCMHVHIFVCMFPCVSMHSVDMCVNMVEAILPVHEKGHFSCSNKVLALQRGYFNGSSLILDTYPQHLKCFTITTHTQTATFAR